ncbi:DNA-3-methyladenine glycosylase [Kocuria rosea]|uniref:Putative 3-methyladenine DNA glycosylase n=1 Tax=Kocuria rosea TaxID=1275 RepID=A0A4R5YBH1_KOCRO|nr:DNA-3-methyladenine glycosylase [Kocuria rosea]TDL42281.1 DNA-3-methyladenine glycosylase [Kocuria rosea]
MSGNGPATAPALLELLSRPAPEVAPRLLGSLFGHRTAEGSVVLRITEVEAYGGPDGSDLPDPGAHTWRGRTARNASMFGPPGHVYVYFTYGMHHAVNLVCRPEGTAGGCLLRAGEVVEGVPLARARRAAGRSGPVPDAALARGPGNLAKALGIDLTHDGAPLTAGEAAAAPGFFLRLPGPGDAPAAGRGPRTGVSGPGGTPEFPWRWWLPGEASVSPYRAAVPRRRR